MIDRGLGHLKPAFMAFLSVAAFAVCGAAPAHASFPGRNGEIAYGAGDYEIGPSGGWEAMTDVWISNPDASALRRLTDGPGQDASGRWSPDSTQLVFARQRPPGGELPPFETLLVSAGGTAAQPVLTHCAGDCRFASWHPDGRHLVVSMSTAGAAGIWSVALDGTGERLLAAVPGAFKAVMSPDATKLAYVVPSPFPNPATVMVSNADGTDPHRIAYGNSPDWSPDSTRIAYQSGDSEDGHHPPWIMVSDADGGRRVPAAPAASLFEDSPSWSPDGSEIVFTATDLYAQDDVILPHNTVLVARTRRRRRAAGGRDDRRLPARLSRAVARHRRRAAMGVAQPRRRRDGTSRRRCLPRGRPRRWPRSRPRPRCERPSPGASGSCGCGSALLAARKAA